MGYDARIVELRDEIKNMVPPLDLPGDQLARFEITERGAFAKAVEAWSSDHRRLYEDLVKLIEATSPDSNQDQAWADRVDRGSGFESTLGAVIQSTQGVPTATAISFSIRTSMAERKRLELLKNARKVAACRDAVASYRKTVADKISVLEVKWEELKTKHKDFDKQEQEVHAEIVKMLEEAVEKGAREHQSRKEKIVGWGVVASKFVGGVVTGVIASKAGVPPEVIEIPAEGAKIEAERWLDMNRQLLERQRKFRDLFQRELSTTLVTFGPIRRDTQDFVEKYSYEPKITNALEEAKKALAALSGSSELTPGQRADAVELERALLPMLESRVKEAKELWDNFVKANHKRFYGGIPTEKVDDLFDLNAWRDRGRLLIDKPKSLAEQLGRWRAEARNRFEVPITGFSPEIRDEIQKRFDEEMKRVIDAMETVEKELTQLMSTPLDRERAEAEAKLNS
jgi:hypothetical protein